MIISILVAATMASAQTATAPAEMPANPRAMGQTEGKKMACCEKMAKGEGCGCCKDMAKDAHGERGMSADGDGDAGHDL